MNTKMLEKTVHFFNVDLAEDISTPGYLKISEAAGRTCTTTQWFLKIQQISQECTCTRVSFQPATFNFIGKETSTYIDFCEFCKNFQEHVYYRKPPANWFWFRILLKMENRHSYYNKDISRSRPLFQKTDIARESVYLRTIDRKLTLNLIVIFNSFTDISFLKYVTKIFCTSDFFQGKIWECFKVPLSVTLFVYILSNKTANQLLLLYTKTLGNIQGNVYAEATVLKCIPSIFFQKFAEDLGHHLKS